MDNSHPTPSPEKRKRGRPHTPNRRIATVLASLAIGADSPSRMSRTAIARAVSSALHYEPEGRVVNRIMRAPETAAASPPTPAPFIVGTGIHAETGERHHLSIFPDHVALIIDTETGAILERHVTGSLWRDGMREAERVTMKLAR